MIQSILLILFGWFLGLFSTLIVRYIERQQSLKDFKLSLHSELKELLPRLAGTYYTLNDSLGLLNKESAEWLHNILKDYPGEFSDRTIEAIEKLSKADDEHLKILSRTKEKSRTEESEAINIKILSMPFLEKSFSSLSMLDVSLKNFILIIYRNICWINEHRERCDFYFKKSFDESMSEKNRTIMQTNMKIDYKIIAKTCRKTADIILKILPKIEN